MIQDSEHLQMARRHLAHAEAIVERQTDLVAQLEAHGHPAALARELLSSFIGTLRQMKAHKDYLEAEAANR